MPFGCVSFSEGWSVDKLADEACNYIRDISSSLLPSGVFAQT